MYLSLVRVEVSQRERVSTDTKKAPTYYDKTTKPSQQFHL